MILEVTMIVGVNTNILKTKNNKKEQIVKLVSKAAVALVKCCFA